MKEYDQPNNEFISIASEPLARWGGQWTEEKLDTFTKYVNAYLTIMNKYRDQYDWKLIYFDGFAGSGSRSETNNNQSDLLLELFSEDVLHKDELDLYQGAAERVLSIDQRGFNYNYFIDKDSTSSNLLQQKLQSYETTDKKLEFRCSDANKQLQIYNRGSVKNKWTRKKPYHNIKGIIQKSKIAAYTKTENFPARCFNGIKNTSARIPHKIVGICPIRDAVPPAKLAYFVFLKSAKNKS